MAIYPPVLLEEEIRMYVIVSKQSQRVVCDDIYLDKQEAETSREAMEHPEELESVQASLARSLAQINIKRRRHKS